MTVFNQQNFIYGQVKQTNIVKRRGHGPHKGTEPYDVKLKAKIIKRYLQGDLSCRMLSWKYKMHPGVISRWLRVIKNHSDRGVHYCSKEYVAILKSKNILVSMTENGDPYENALAERVNGILKGEFGEKYNDSQTAKKDVAKSVRLYNTERLHLCLAMMTPEYIYQTATVITKLWKNYKKRNDNPINSKGNKSHPKVNAISPWFFPNSKLNKLTY